MRETLREKISSMERLKRLPRLDKVAYGMLTVPVMIEVVGIIAVIVASLYAIYCGLGDSNGGGWLIFIVIAMWFVFFSFMVVCLVQVFFWKQGIRKFVEGQRKAARAEGVISATIGCAINVILLFFLCEPDEIKWIFWVFVIGIVYHGIIVFLLKIGMRKSKEGMNKIYKAVLFDFDYTLGDSTEGIAQSVEFALEQLGEQPQGLESIRKTIGMTLKEAYRTLTGNMDEERAKLFDHYFRQKADEVMVAGTSLYEPTRMVLESLQAQGCKIGIVTTKGHHRIEAILEKFGMSHIVDVIVGGDDVKKQKPAADGLIYAMKLLGVADEEVLYVGDTVIDAKAAKSAGVDFVAVLTGTTEESGFVTYPKKAVANDLYGLMNFLRDENKL